MQSLFGYSRPTLIRVLVSEILNFRNQRHIAANLPALLKPLGRTRKLHFAAHTAGSGHDRSRWDEPRTIWLPPSIVYSLPLCRSTWTPQNPTAATVTTTANPLDSLTPSCSPMVINPKIPNSRGTARSLRSLSGFGSIKVCWGGW